MNGVALQFEPVLDPEIALAVAHAIWARAFNFLVVKVMVRLNSQVHYVTVEEVEFQNIGVSWLCRSSEPGSASSHGKVP